MDDKISVPRVLLTGYLVRLDHLYENSQDTECLSLILVLNTILNSCIEKEKQTGTYIDSLSINRTLFAKLSSLCDIEKVKQVEKSLVMVLSNIRKKKLNKLYF